MIHAARKLLLLQGLASAVLVGQTTINGSRTILGTWDASGAAKTVPVKSGTLANRPASCLANVEMYNVTDPATAGQSLYLCNSVGSGWNLVGDGGSGGGISLLGSARPGQLCFDGTNFVGPRTASCGFEDFLGGGTSSTTIGQHGWSTTLIASCTNSHAVLGSDSEETGKFRYGCSSSIAGQGETMGLGQGLSYTNRTNWSFQWGFNLTTTGGNRFRVGLSSQQSALAPANFLGIGADDEPSWDTSGSGVGNFKMYICNATANIGSCDVYDTGIAQDTGNHYAAVSSASAGVYILQFDNITKTFCASGCDVTATHVPATTVNFWPLWVIGNQAASARTAVANWFQWHISLTR